MEHILECPICFNGYNLDDRLPRLLDCQHSLCSKCLPNIIKDGNSIRAYVECPICKGKTKKSLKDIPRSLLTVQLMDATKYKADTADSKLEQNTRPSLKTNTSSGIQLPSSSPQNTYQASYPTNKM